MTLKIKDLINSSKFTKIVKIVAVILLALLPLITYILGRWYERRLIQEMLKAFEFEKVGSQSQETSSKDLVKTTQNEDIVIEQKNNVRKVEFDGLIAGADITDCDIFLQSTNGKSYKIGGLSSLGYSGGECIKNPYTVISESGEYFVFEDVSGGVDTMIQIFSTKTKNVNTIDVFGPSTHITELKFLEGDILELRTRWIDTQEEMATKYNIPKLYLDFPNNVNEYGYFLIENDN